MFTLMRNTFFGLLLTAPVITKATEYVNNEYVWSFLTEAPWPSGYTQNTGKPDNMSWHYEDYPRAFFDRINNALPEREVNEAFLADDSGINITLVEAGEVFVTFLHEGAGYRNSFGYFTFDADNPPSSPDEVNEIIVFPNLSYPHMATGHRLSLGSFEAGTSIGFFIAANGYSWWTGVKSRAVPYYYSLSNLNPETTPELRQHNVVIYDEETSEAVIGFEDLPRTWGDNDFNDAVFSVSATPSTAIDTSTLSTMPDVNDSDADGVSDTDDEFPLDYNRSLSSYYPSASEWVTLAFEDNWPRQGDYDLNDLVVREQLRTIYNSDGDISGFKLTGYIDARGASNRNGFALRLVDEMPENIQNALITINGQDFNKSVEEFQTDAVIILWSDSHVFTTTGGEGQCSHFNTVKSCPSYDPIPFELDVNFNVPMTALNHSQFDFFIFDANNRAREIHFADYAPTDLFDFSQFGKIDDTSDVSTGRYFRNENNLPWALKVNAQWRHPREYIDVVWAYPDFELWVESSGQEAMDWFTTSTRSTHYY